ncbi:hypothetical protein RJ639_027178 [Escallonia herrerae]|uniref:BSD domain-containing protein n=1 Tax=Escallonia herrerae TaxID=1293975 RepID=A0AA89BGF2_9ASTE|nr:hypothetical protein RJ639_027178 [Escallonia herrerae]
MSSWLPFLKSPPDRNPSPRLPPENTPSPAALSKALGHQLRLAASFLAPPPQPHSAAAAAANDVSPPPSCSQAFLGVRNDLAEIGGSLKTTVTGISRFASNLLQFRADGGDDVDVDDDGVGITEEVVEFVGAISLQPEFWTNFPLALRNGIYSSFIAPAGFRLFQSLVSKRVAVVIQPNLADAVTISSPFLFLHAVEELDGIIGTNFCVHPTEKVGSEVARVLECRNVPLDFDMSDIQREHAATIEHLVPSFAALRQKVCVYLTEEQFWMIYFILLLPRLNEDDFKLLSTPEARLFLHMPNYVYFCKMDWLYYDDRYSGFIFSNMLTTTEKTEKSNFYFLSIVEVREVLLQRLRDKKIDPLGTPEETETVDSSQKGDKLRSTQGVSSPSDADKLPIQVMNTVEGVEIYKHEITEQRSGEEEKDRSTFADARKGPKSEEEVSFSDLEDDDNDLSGRLSGFRKAESSCSESNEWVRLNKDVRRRVGQSTSREKDSEGESSNEWLAVDDIDSDSFSGA